MDLCVYAYAVVAGVHVGWSGLSGCWSLIGMGSSMCMGAVGLSGCMCGLGWLLQQRLGPGFFDCLLLQGPIFLFVFFVLAACMHGCCCLGWLVALCVV